MGNNYNEKLKNSYYNLLKKTLVKKQSKTYNNKNNINYSLLSKSFSNSYINEGNLVLKNENINWETYLERKLLYLSNNYNYIWAKKLYKFITKNKFPNQYIYLSIIFFEEYQLMSIPKLSHFHPILHYSGKNLSLYKSKSKQNFEKNNISCNEEENIESDIKSTNINHKNGYKGIIKEMYNKNNIKINKDVLGSLASVSLDEINSFLLENEPTLKYKIGKAKLKEYIDIFQRHLCHKDHPLNIILNKFSKEFNLTAQKTISACKNILDVKESNKKCEDIIHQLQEFIITFQITTKLFYSKCISYDSFNDEKDEFINLIAFLVFNTGNTYKNIYEILEIINNTKIENFDCQLEIFGEMEPEDFGVDEKFCLNDTTKEYMEDYKNKKIKMLKINPELKDRILISDKKKSNKFKSINDIEEDEEEKQSKNSENTIKKKRDNFNIPTAAFSLSNYTMPKTKSLDIYAYLNELNDNKQKKIEKDILNTNILDNLNIDNENEYKNKSNKDNININLNLKISEVEKNNQKNQFLLNFARTYSTVFSYDEVTINEPYYEAIKALKNIIKFKSPLEKMVIMASLGSFISNNIYKYWKPIERLIDMSILDLDVDDLMKVLKYIVYKSGMSKLFIHLDFIKYFTIPETRTTMIGYYYTLLEGIINSILSAKNKNDFVKI